MITQVTEVSKRVLMNVTRNLGQGLVLMDISFRPISLDGRVSRGQGSRDLQERRGGWEAIVVEQGTGGGTFLEGRSCDSRERGREVDVVIIAKCTKA